MALNNTELSVILKEVIDPEIADHVYKAPILWNLLPKDTDMVNGRGTFVIAKVGKNYSQKWFGEGGIYPAGGNNERIKMNVPFARYAITSRMTRDALEGANKHAIIDAIREEVTDNTSTALQELNEQSYGDGTGVKAVVKSVSGQDVTFRSDASDVSPDNANHAISYGSALLLKNGNYDIIAGSVRGSYSAIGDVASADNVISTIVDKDTATFTTTLPSAGDVLVDGDMVVYADSYNQAVNGMDYHINSGTGTYQNKSRSTYETLRCYTLNASNTAMTIAMLYKLVNQAKYLRNKSVLNGEYIIISSPAQTHRMALLAELSTSGYDGSSANSGLNDMPNGGTLDYGFKYFKFAGLNWVEDPRCPDHKLFIICPQKFKVCEFKPLSTVPLGGDNGFAPVPAFNSSGVGSYSDNALFTMTWKGNIVSKDPQLGGMKLDNLSISGLANITNAYALS